MLALPKTQNERAMLAEALRYRWDVNAREKQRLPQQDFFVWLILAGRGFGKTRTGAETVRQWVKDILVPPIETQDTSLTAHQIRQIVAD